MYEHKRKFVSIVKAELDDLIEDLNHLVDDYKEKKDHDLITSYVFLENLALLRHEMYGIRRISDVISTLKLEDYKDIREISDCIKEILENKISGSDFAGCLLPMISRKIDKAANYVNNYI